MTNHQGSSIIMDHQDGGLQNPRGFSQVTAVVQAFLHSPPMVQYLRNDKDHRKTCRSLLQCVTCAMYKVLSDIASKGLGDSSPLVLKWEGLLVRLRDRNEPVSILEIFLDLMIMQRLRQNQQSIYFPKTDVDSHPLSSMWKTASTMEVSCKTCGRFKHTERKLAFELAADTSDFKSSLIEALFAAKEATCPLCQREKASYTVENVALAQCPVVRVKRCSENFIFPFELHFQGVFHKLSLTAAIIQKEGEPYVCVGICPDGKFREFQDSKISPISPARLLKLVQQSQVTFIFRQTKERLMLQKQAQELKRNHNTSFMKKDTVQVVGFPRTSVDLSKAGGSADCNASTTAQDTSLLDLSANESGDNHNASTNAQDKSSLDLSTAECTAGQGTPKSKRNVCTQTSVSVMDAAVQTHRTFVTYEVCKFNPKFKLFTGLDRKDFDVLYNLIGGHEVIRGLKLEYDAHTPVKLRETKVSSENKLLMFLLRLRRGLALEELSEIFDISDGTVGKIVYAMTRLIYLTFKGMEEDMFPSAEKQRKDKPKKMRPFKNLRILLDGASFNINTPSNFEQQGNTFSRYKSHNVLIVSIGISCNGATIFCSDGMEGCMSDKEVILQSGLLKKLSRGDGVMTDRGYDLTAELQAIGCDFFKPPSLGKRKTFTAEEEIMTKAIASARIYTEHAIADIKDNSLLTENIPLTLLPVIGDLVYIAAYLRNFQSGRIKNHSFRVSEE